MVTSTEPARRTRGDRRRERTRRRLLDAGRTLIAERGVAGLRIQEITERADVALGSFYNHFTTKEELVEQVVGESLAALAEVTVTDLRPDADPAHVVAGAVLSVVRLARDEPDLARLVVNLSHADRLFGAAMTPYARIAVERGLRGGRFAVADVDVTLTAVVGGALALIREMVEGRYAGHPATGSRDGVRPEQAFARHTLAALGLTPADAAAAVAATEAAEAGGHPHPDAVTATPMDATGPGDGPDA